MLRPEITASFTSNRSPSVAKFCSWFNEHGFLASPSLDGTLSLFWLIFSADLEGGKQLRKVCPW